MRIKAEQLNVFLLTPVIFIFFFGGNNVLLLFLKKPEISMHSLKLQSLIETKHYNQQTKVPTVEFIKQRIIIQPIHLYVMQRRLKVS